MRDEARAVSRNRAYALLRQRRRSGRCRRFHCHLRRIDCRYRADRHHLIYINVINIGFDEFPLYAQHDFIGQRNLSPAATRQLCRVYYRAKIIKML